MGDAGNVTTTVGVLDPCVLRLHLTDCDRRTDRQTDRHPDDGSSHALHSVAQQKLLENLLLHGIFFSFLDGHGAFRCICMHCL